MENTENASQFLFYASADGNIKVNVIVDESSETVWATQKTIAELFGVVKSTISEHFSNIYDSGELNIESTVRKFRTVQEEGGRLVKRELEFYNLDAIISVGYRVNSYQATQFRIWATKVLKEYLVKGFALDDERLKQGKSLFGKDYFNDLLERIREIRASERRFYQKITDLYATASDYDPKSPVTQTFFAIVQNKLEYAITQLTAPEIIKTRADSDAPNMGLTTWKNAGTGGKISKSDVFIAKNYLSEDEIAELSILVNMYLDYAELQAKRNKLMSMSDWAERLDTFLKFNEYDILNDGGKIRSDFAKMIAEKEFEKFRIVQDINYKSDFDLILEKIKTSGDTQKP